MKSVRYTIKAYTAALVTLAAGVILSIDLSDWSWFSRSGSLIVVYGIILTSHHIFVHMHNLNHIQHQHRRASQIQRDWAKESKYEFIHDDVEHTWMNEKSGLLMLVLGTLIWGFGDLIGMF